MEAKLNKDVKSAEEKSAEEKLRCRTRET